MSVDLMHRAGGPLAHRLTGDPNRWARDGALLGLVTGYVGPAAAMFGWTLHPWLLACAAAFAVGGAALASFTAAAVELSRGKVPLPALAVALPAVAAGLGVLWAGSAAALVGAPVLAAASFGGVSAATLVGVLWLPYTVSSALDLPRWPWLVAASALSPALGWLAWWVFVLL